MKYILTDESQDIGECVLYRIKYIDSINLIGGFVESERNLSQEGNCLILGEAKAMGSSKVHGDAILYDNVSIYDSAEVYGNAKMFGDSKVSMNGKVFGDATISGGGRVSGNAKVYGRASISGKARIGSRAEVYGRAVVGENALIVGDSRVMGHSKVRGYSVVKGEAKIFGFCSLRERANVGDQSQVFGDAVLSGDIALREKAEVYGKARLKYGRFTGDVMQNMKQNIASSLNIYPMAHYYYLYKKVDKLREGVYKSLYDGGFIYKDGEVAVAEDPDEDVRIDCSSGLHVSHPNYWSSGNTLIGVKIHEDDIITCQSGKLRVRKLEVIGEIHSELHEPFE